MTRKRWVMLSNRITIELEDIPDSNVENKIVLIFAKDGKPNEQANETANEGSRDRWRFWQHAVVHGQPESVDEIDQGIQLEDPSVFCRYEVKRVEDGSKVEPDRQHDLQNVGDVPVVDIGSRKKKCHPQRKQHERQQRNGQIQPRPVERMPHEWNQHRQRD